MRTQLATIILVTCGAAATARAVCPPPAETVTCDGGTTGELREYLIRPNPQPDDTRASNTDCGWEVRLRGWWFKPTTPMPTNGYPTVIYSHGSEDLVDKTKKKSAKCTIVEPLVAAGYAVFVPHRRGHGKSTGMYYETYRDLVSAANCALDPQNCPVYRREATMSYLHLQANDVEDAFNKVKGWNQVNEDKMFIMGHSFGAMVTMFANEKDLGHKAAVNFAGGAESWDGDPCLGSSASNYSRCSLWDRGVLQEYLYTAVDNSTNPVLLFDTNDDVTLEPIYELTHYAWKNYRWRYQGTVFGGVDGATCKFPNPDGTIVTCDSDDPRTKECPPNPDTGAVDTCGNVAHGVFSSNSDQIAKWMPTVLTFFSRFGGP